MKECQNISQLWEHCSGEEGLICNEWCIKCPLFYELNIKFENISFPPNFLCCVIHQHFLMIVMRGRCRWSNLTSVTVSVLVARMYLA